MLGYSAIEPGARLQLKLETNMLWEMTHRTEEEMLCDVLNAATFAVTRTKLMYKAFLSHSRAEACTALLAERGLLRFDPADQTYIITRRGRQVLEKVHELREMLVLV